MVSIVENGRYLLLNDEVYSQRVERRSLRNQRSHLLIFYTEISYLNLLQIGIKIRTANMFFSGPKFHECKMLWSLTNSGSRAPLSDLLLAAKLSTFLKLSIVPTSIEKAK